MTKEIRFYSIWILILTHLFYNELWGLNTLIAAMLTVILFGYRYFKSNEDVQREANNYASRFWIFGASLWLISAAGLIILGGWFQITMYIITMLYFISLQDKKFTSLLTSPIQTAQSFLTGVVRLFTDIEKLFHSDTQARTKKIIRATLLIGIGLLICIVFLKLYQMADQNFYNLTKFINLEWISWGIIFFYLFLLWILYGIFFYQSEERITHFDNNLKNEIDAGYNDSIQQFFGIKQEKKLAILTIGTLSLMLLLLLSIDIHFLFTEFGTDRGVVEYSQAVHQGVNALIFSLILVIILISYLFRGTLNFGNNKTIKILGILWIGLNCILVITTGLKNYDYISQFGFTYKRLGVLLYLLLCLSGLIFSYIKIIQARSVWYLIRNTSLSFLVAFTCIGLFNWNNIITEYNLSRVNKSRLDLEYLYSLGSDTYSSLMKYHLHNDLTQTPLFFSLAESIKSSRHELYNSKSTYSWRSINWRDYHLLHQLNSFQFSSVNNRQLSQNQIQKN